MCLAYGFTFAFCFLHRFKHEVLLKPSIPSFAVSGRGQRIPMEPKLAHAGNFQSVVDGGETSLPHVSKVTLLYLVISLL